MLCEAVGRREAYLCGYTQPFGWSTVLRWWNDYERNERECNDILQTFIDKRKTKRKSYIESIQLQFPDFLHKLYRYASNHLNHNTNNYQIRHLMIVKAKRDFPTCPIRSTLKLSKYNFEQFFKLNGGKYRALCTKPRLTAENIELRNAWARKYAQLIQDDEFHYVFLDEKWFFTSSNCKKYKFLPPNKAIGETAKDAYVPAPRIRNRRKPTKVIFLSCVAPPVKNQNFDGKVMMKRVSTYVKAKCASYTEQFTNDWKVNRLVREGLWKNLYIPGMLHLDFYESIGSYFDLEEYIADRLVLTYATYSRSGKTSYLKHIDLFDSETKKVKGEKKIIYHNRPILGEHRAICTKEGISRLLTLEDCKLEVETLAGMLVERDCSCDSEFMLDVVDELGTAIRTAYHWLDQKTVPVHLFMDNAGGHGTEEAKLAFVDILKENYNVEVVWQCSNSPETNILDLGIWVILQSLVEYMHKSRRMNEDSLAETVEKAWGMIDASVKFLLVIDRWKRVLGLIILGKGDNHLVETCRGLRKSLVDDAMKILVDLDDDLESEDGGCADGAESGLSTHNDGDNTELLDCDGNAMEIMM